MPGIDEKTNVYRVRQKAPEQYIRFRTKDLEGGIKALIGFKKDGGSDIQSLIFEKNLFKTKGEVKDWINEHKEFRVMEEIVNQTLVGALGEEIRGKEMIELYGIPVEAFNEIDSTKRLFIVREYDVSEQTGLKITKKDIEEMYENYINNVRGQKLDIDYAHKDDIAKGDKAAGWFGDLEKDKITLSNGKEVMALFTYPTWTSEASKEISGGEWKYFSPEIAFEWYDPESKKQYKNVLFGGALTNRPQLKGQPEYSIKNTEFLRKEDDNVDIKKLFEELFGKKMSESEAETDEKIVKTFSDKVKEISATVAEQDKDITSLSEKIEKLNGEKGEKDEAIKKLTEESEKIKTARQKEKYVSLCEKVSKKIAPEALKEGGWFFEMFSENVDKGEKYAESLPEVMPEAPKGTGTERNRADEKLSEEEKLDKEIRKKLKEKDISEDSDKFFDKYRELSREISDKKEEEKAMKGGN